MPTEIWSEDFDSASSTTTQDRAYSSNGLITYLPSGWVKFSDETDGSGIGMTIGRPWRLAGTNSYWTVGPGLQSASFGDAKNDANQYQKGWVIGYSTSGSSNTGPYGANDNSTTEGGFSSTQRYLLLETTQIGTNSFSDQTNRYRHVHLIRTNQIDLTSYSATDDIRFEGYFHMFGDHQGALGFACTTSDTIAGEVKYNGEIGWVNNAAFTGSGFTGYTNDSGDGEGGGGLTIEYDSTGNGTIDVLAASGKKRIVGQQQTSGHSTSSTPSDANRWRKFSCSLTGAGGQNVYLYILSEQLNNYTYRWGTTTAAGSSYYKSDTCVDTLSVNYYPPATNDEDHFKGKIFNIAGSSIQKICNEDLDEDDKLYVTDGAAAATYHRLKININGTSGWSNTNNTVSVGHNDAGNSNNFTTESDFDHGPDVYQDFTFHTGSGFVNMAIYFHNVPGGNADWQVASSSVTENAYDATTNPNGLYQLIGFTYNSGGGFWSSVFRIGISTLYAANNTVTVNWEET